jgi:hypothetical protein
VRKIHDISFNILSISALFYVCKICAKPDDYNELMKFRQVGALSLRAYARDFKIGMPYEIKAEVF